MEMKSFQDGQDSNGTESRDGFHKAGHFHPALHIFIDSLILSHVSSSLLHHWRIWLLSGRTLSSLLRGMRSPWDVRGQSVGGTRCG
ncbi:MAG: hypothetical protein LQ345_005565 [Seirophora villosa]|nr:MAG: hypothetical protein LQ345_005565 [Seirophora villosa]